MNDALQQRDVIELWLMAGEGAANDAQLERLNQLIADDPEARRTILGFTRHQGWLAWNAASAPLPAALAELAPAAVGSGQAESESPRTARVRTWALRAAVLLVACGVGFLAADWFDRPGLLDARSQAAGRPAIQATMVSSTGCVWGTGQEHSLPNGAFAGGDSLQLLEGLAEFNIRFAGAAVAMQMEGPASVVLTSQGAASVSYGKVIVAVQRGAGASYPIETSLGRLLAEPGAEVGLAAFGSKAEIHCFAGRAAVESPWLHASDEAVASVSLAAGEALRFEDVGGGALKATRVTADREQFTPHTSMTADFLSVSPEYVRDVVASKPVAYWRFEDPDAAVVRNEMGPSHACSVKGAVEWVGPDGNRALQLGMAAEHGSIVSEEAWDDVLADGFSIELWMKPSHYHLGSLVGFVGEFDAIEQRNRHGVLLETCGPAAPSTWSRLREVRFLHRSQLSADSQHGVSCFSGQPYDTRRWQHVVAVKDGAELRLFIDGRRVAAAEDTRATPRGLHLVIGQLYTETVERFFIGQLDEVAIYDYPLTDAQITNRYRLLRPEQPASEGML